jgi:N6-L-threonylcarbamoyladenine synthase
VRVFIEQKGPDFVQANLADICASIQHTLVKTLLAKLSKAAQETGCTQVALAGGVAANRGLRDGLKDLAQTQSWQVFYPRLEFCTDNAAMIGITAYYAWQVGHRGTLSDTLFVNEEAAPEGMRMRREV